MFKSPTIEHMILHKNSIPNINDRSLNNPIPAICSLDICSVDIGPILFPSNHNCNAC